MWKILHESVGILIIASVVSSMGGVGLEALINKMVIIIPILVLLPSLNDMIGSFGAIIASRFAMMLFKKEVHEKNWMHQKCVLHIFFVVLGIAVLAALYAGVLAYLVAMIRGFPFEVIVFEKVLFIALMTTIFLVCILFVVSIVGGFYVFKQKHDPDNYLIPLTTAIADFGSMVILSLLVLWLF